MVNAATHETIPVQSKTSERILRAQIDLFLSQLIQLPIFFSVIIYYFYLSVLLTIIKPRVF